MSTITFNRAAAPAPMPTRGAVPVLAIAALAAMFLTTLLGITNPRTAGWQPDHGHVYRNGAPVPHTHPWDGAPAATAEPLCNDRPSTPDVVFTPSAEGLAGASITAPALPTAFATPCTPALTSARSPFERPPAQAGVWPSVPTPPPRG